MTRGGFTIMKLKTSLRHIREGFKNIWRNGWMSFASISAVTITLLITAIFLSILINLNHVGEQIENETEIHVFIDLTATEADKRSLREELESISEVKSVIYQSKEEGLEELIDSLGDEGDVFASLKQENPLPDTFRVKTNDPQDIIEVAEEIKPLTNVTEVNYGAGTVERMFDVMNVSRNIGAALVVGLLLTAMFLISNTIKITIVARRQEIEIMKLVGAANSFIRGPFIVEGLLLGVFGAVLPMAVMLVGYPFLYQEFQTRFSSWFISLLPPMPFVYQMSMILLLIGMFIGVWGSTLSIRKFLKV